MQKKHVVVLGCGRIGRTIAEDLNTEYSVTVVDENSNALSSLPKNINIRKLDITKDNESSVSQVITDADLVVSALPSKIGHETLKTVIGVGKKSVVDISFSPEDPFELDLLAKENGVVAAVDCGIAPGFPNLCLAHEAEHMNVEEFICYVGGLPVERKLPWQYKALFAPTDVIEEYTRPARFRVNWRSVEKPALSDREEIVFPGIGTLEAFNTDGLRTLLTTMQTKVPTMREKTLRYPGHVALFQSLLDSGLFSKKPRKDFGDITPFEYNSALLADAWKLYLGEREFTALLIRIRGTENQRRKEVTYTLLDHGDSETQTTSMARTTGYTATGIAHMLLKGMYKTPGVAPLEFIGKEPGCYEYLMKHLRTRGVMVQKTINTSKKA